MNHENEVYRVHIRFPGEDSAREMPGLYEDVHHALKWVNDFINNTQHARRTQTVYMSVSHIELGLVVDLIYANGKWVVDMD